MSAVKTPGPGDSNSYRKIRVFVASPGDVAEEKRGLGKVIESVNRVLGDRLGVVLELKEWRQVAPAMGRPEDVILDQLPVESWDIFVGILWLRFGLPPGAVDPATGRAFDSGTEEEFALAYRAWQQSRRPRILFYRSLRLPARLLEIDGAQFDRVTRFFRQFDAVNGQHPGLFSEYLEVEDFKDLVREHLEKLLLDDQASVSAESPARTVKSGLPTTRGFDAKGEERFDQTSIIPPPPAPAPAPRLPVRSVPQTGKPKPAAVFQNPFIIGRPITDPADFFGRERETEFALARLRTRQSVSIVGERKIGKTSLLHFILHRTKQELDPSARLGFLDLMGGNVRTPEALLTQILESLGIRDRAATLTGLAERLATLDKAGEHSVVAFDEMEMVIRFPTEFARDFFETLRAAAQAGHLTLLTVSRISLQEMHENGALVSPLYNIMGPLKLGLFTEKEAREFVTVPRNDVRFSVEQVSEILRRGGRHPLHLQALCFHAAQANHEHRSDWTEVWKETEAEVQGMLESRKPCVGQ